MNMLHERTLPIEKKTDFLEVDIHDLVKCASNIIVPL